MANMHVPTGVHVHVHVYNGLQYIIRSHYYCCSYAPYYDLNYICMCIFACALVANKIITDQVIEKSHVFKSHIDLL